MGEPLGPVTIGAREIYDQVVRLQVAVERMGDQHIGTADDIKDHEARLRSLERGRWPLPTVSVLVALVALVLAVLPKLVH
jgi:hypothetical protein